MQWVDALAALDVACGGAKHAPQMADRGLGKTQPHTLHASTNRAHDSFWGEGYQACTYYKYTSVL